MSDDTEVLSRRLQEAMEAAIRATSHGRDLTAQFVDFPELWSIFNGIYHALGYAGREWERVARFALDTRWTVVWSGLSTSQAVLELAYQPCVGDGRTRSSPYKAADHIRQAFQTLRVALQVDVDTVCQGARCEGRKPRCLTRQWPKPPEPIETPDHAIHTPLGATLAILYQIRCNWVHGSKLEPSGGLDYERNQTLMRISAQITRDLLGEIVRLNL